MPPDFGGNTCPTCRGTGRVVNGYADRASFIRVQVRLAGRGYRRIDTGQPGFGVRYVCGCRQWGQVCDECIADSERERELLRAIGPAWFPCPYGKSVWTVNGGDDKRGAVYWVDPLGVAHPVGVSRGFVSAITLPAAAFTESLARAVWSAQPVTTVTFSDCRPADRTGINGQWYWFKQDPLRDQWGIRTDMSHARIPDEFFEFMAGNRVTTALPFDTDERAMDFLERKAIEYGHSLVGSPPARG